MKCSICGKDCNLTPADVFCGDCGHAASAHQAAVAQPTPVIPPTPPATQAVARPVQSGTYSAEISRQNRGCLVFLVDQSGSMDEPIGGGTGDKKKQVVADAINRLIYNTVLRCAKEDGVRPYFDVGVWSYAAGKVQSAFGADLLSITDISNQPKRTEVRNRRVPDGAGGVFEEQFELPVWFDPAASGDTPMNAAFRAVLDPLRGWLSQHPSSFPPIVINLTDGAYTDQSPAQIAYELMQMGTSDGNVLVFNCHISRQMGGTVVAFPGDAQGGALQGLARELYDLSSALPDPMFRQAQAKGYAVSPGARGYAFGADLVTMIDFLDIGTRAVQDRMETA